MRTKEGTFLTGRQDKKLTLIKSDLRSVMKVIPLKCYMLQAFAFGDIIYCGGLFSENIEVIN
jgi:hypothetical protein